MKGLLNKILIAALLLALAPLAAQAGPGCWTAVGADDSRCPEPTRLGFQHAIEQCTPETVQNPQGNCLDAIKECASLYFIDCAEEAPFLCTKINMPAGQNPSARTNPHYTCQDDPRPTCDQKIKDEFPLEVTLACTPFVFRPQGHFDNPFGNLNPTQSPSGSGNVPPGHQRGERIIDFSPQRAFLPTGENPAPLVNQEEIVALGLAGGGCSLSPLGMSSSTAGLGWLSSLGLILLALRMRKK